jgi:cyclase
VIGIVDYGAGNLHSVRAALDRLGAPWRTVTRPGDLRGLGGVILPGVGRFAAAMGRLGRRRMIEPLRAFIRSGAPFLGICLGMQLLFDGSDEDPGVPGLGILKERIVRLPSPRLPHIGWALARPEAPVGDPLFAGLPGEFYAYFAHSFAAPAGAAGRAARTEAPAPFASAVRAGRRAWGVQFHPEKSGAAGIRLLANFAAACGVTASIIGTRTTDPALPAEVPAGAAPRVRRIIPCLDVAGGRVVKGVRFRDLRDAGDPVERARAYDRDGADELCLLDISASVEERRPLVDLVRRVAKALSVPLTVGGGVRDLKEMRRLLLAGADRVSIGTAALLDPGLIRRAAGAFGDQFVVVSIDARRSGAGWEVTTHGGRRGTGKDAIAWVRQVERLGAGEILLNAMDADGTRSGYDIPLTRAVVKAVRIPVIASGGAGTAADMARVLLEGEADAALAASMFHDGVATIAATKRRLAAAGVAVRP